LQFFENSITLLNKTNCFVINERSFFFAVILWAQKIKKINYIKSRMGQLQKVLISFGAIKTLPLVNHGGIQGASMAKVAKLVTFLRLPFIFILKKQDLVNHCILMLRSLFAVAALKDTSLMLPSKQF
jgi:hypothetical protein